MVELIQSCGSCWAMCTVCNILLSRRRSLGLLAAITGQTAFGWQTGNAAAADMDYRLPTEILGIRVPDSSASAAAAALMRAAVPDVLFNHCLRTFLLGMIDARNNKLKIDEEAAFIASMLHDVALVSAYAGDLTKPFEENGATFAQSFATKRGFAQDRADKIYKAILLHAGGAGGNGPDIKFVMVGAGQDVFGPTVAELADAQLAATEQAVPRLGFKRGFIALLEDHARRSSQPGWTAGFVSRPPPRFLMNRWSE